MILIQMVKILGQLREEKGKTQRQVAEELNVALSSVAMYETGARTPSLKIAKRLAQYFNVNVEDIFFGNNDHDMRAKLRGKGKV